MDRKIGNRTSSGTQRNPAMGRQEKNKKATASSTEKASLAAGKTKGR